jgi:hypothetical protein
MSAHNAMNDIYGNLYGYGLDTISDTVYTNLPLNLNITGITTASTTTNPIWMGGSAGTGTGPYVVVPGNTWQYNFEPNNLTLTPEVIDCLFEKMVTTVDKNQKVIVCVDLDLTSEQCHEIKEGLNDAGFDGIVMRGARAGTGFGGNPQNLTKEEKRVDILARIGELWELAPELKLTDLLEWWGGEEMQDEDFASAVETYFLKVTNGLRGKP